MEDVIKQFGLLVNILSPLVLGLFAYWEFNKKNQREKHNDDVESRDKQIESLQKQYQDMYDKWLSSEKLVDELRRELNDRKKDES